MTRNIFQNLLYYKFIFPAALGKACLDLMSLLLIFKIIKLQIIRYSRYCLLVPSIRAWNLSGFMIINFSLKQCIAFSLSSSRVFWVFMSSWIPLFSIWFVMPSAKFASFAFLLKKKRSFLNILNKIWRRIDHFGIPDSMILKMSSASFIFTPSYLLFNWKFCYINHGDISMHQLRAHSMERSYIKIMWNKVKTFSKIHQRNTRFFFLI